MSRSLADWLVQDAEILARTPEAAALFVPGGRLPREGERLVQADLARAFEEIARDGARDGFYEGPLGERLAGLGAQGSPLSPDDLAGYRARWVTPLSTTYRGHVVHELPPSTQGFTALQICNLLEGYDVASWGEGTADYYHHRRRR